MGFLEDIEAMELSDEQKDQLRRAHVEEVSPIQADLEARKARDKKEAVETEVAALADLIGEQNVGPLKYFRRVLLSDDEEPGLVLLSDDELQLADAQRTGAAGRQEITTAGALRDFVALLKQSAGTSNKLHLSDDLAANNDNGRPDNTDKQDNPADRSKQAKENLSRVTGLPVVERKRTRYSRNSVGGAS